MNNFFRFCPTLKYTYLLLLWLLPLDSYGNPFRTERIQEIPFHCTVYAIEKDEHGMMWIGTGCGLRIYNGYEYQELKQELDTIPVVCLLTDTAAMVIWVGTTAGLYAVDYRSGSITKAYDKHKTVRGLLKSRHEGLIVAYSDGTLLSIYPDGHTTRASVPEMANLNTHPFFHIMMIEDERGLFFFSKERVYLRNTTGKVEKITLEKNIETKLPTYLAGHKDIFILSSWGKGVLLLDRKTLRDITPGWMNSLNKVYGTEYTQCLLKEDLLYIYYPNASVWVLDLNTGAYNKFWEDTYHFAVRELETPFFVDQDKTLWIGLRLGLLKVQHQDTSFTCLLNNFPGLPVQPSIRDIKEDRNGDLYAGSYQGLFHYNREAGKWDIFSELTSEKAIPCGLLNELNADYLYIVSEGEPFYRFHKKKKVFETGFYTFTGDSSYLINLRAYCLLKDKNGKIWIGCDKGLMSYNTHTQALKAESSGPGTGSFYITYMKQSTDENIIWLCSSAGLLKLDINRGITQRFNRQSKPALSESEVYFVDEDKNGNLWIGTKGGGIDIMDKTQTRIRNISTHNSSLASDVIFGLLWENEYTVWISTQRGLSRYDMNKDILRNYSTEEGLCNNEFNRNSFLKDHRGRMYFGGVSGITAFSPENLADVLTPVSLFVSRIVAWDGAGHAEKIYRPASSGKIIMEPSDRSLTFTLGLSDYTRPNDHNYYYRIIGLYDDEWTSLGNQHILRLQSLPYGSWTVELKAVSSRGILSDNLPAYTVTVKRPYYRTWWFYTLLSIAGVTLVYAVLWVRFRNLQQLAEQKIQIASDLHDEIGGIVTGIVMQASLLNKMHLSEAEKQLKVHTIINAGRSLSVAVRDVLWSIDARNDTAGKLAGYMLERTQEVLNRTGIALRFYMSGVEEQLKISTATRQHLYRIFKEAVNNALKHSAVTCITVTYSHNTAGFCLIVENDGLSPSNDPARTHSGQGLRNMEMRAKKLKAFATFIRLADRFKVVVTSSSKSAT